MTKLQSCVSHSGDCSCYQVISDKTGAIHDCDVCDCGALRNAIKESCKDNTMIDETVFECWAAHISAILRT